jgi:hypothetical protein
MMVRVGSKLINLDRVSMIHLVVACASRSRVE